MSFIVVVVVVVVVVAVVVVAVVVVVVVVVAVVVVTHMQHHNTHTHGAAHTLYQSGLSHDVTVHRRKSNSRLPAPTTTKLAITLPSVPNLIQMGQKM
jgi:hypothetical protein